MNLRELMQVARGASGGKWEALEGQEAFSVSSDGVPITWDDHGGEVFTEGNARFISTFNPEFVMELLTEIGRLDQELAGYKTRDEMSEPVDFDSLMRAIEAEQKVEWIENLVKYAEDLEKVCPDGLNRVWVRNLKGALNDD